MLLGNEPLGQSATGTGTFTPTTLVTASRSTTWTVRKAIASSRSTTWTVRKAIAINRTATWTVRTAIGVARSVTWNTRKTISISRTASWSVRVSVALSRSISWNVHKLISITRDVIWNAFMTEPPAIALTASQTLKAHDFGMRLTYTLTFQGEPVSLVGRTVYINLKHEQTGTEFKRLVNVDDAETATVNYRVQDGDFDLLGYYQAEFEINYPDGSVLTIPNTCKLSIKIVPDIA